MRKSDIPIVIANSLCGSLSEIRAFGWGRVVSGELGQHYVLIVQERGNPHHTLYEYDDPQEYLADVHRVVRFGTDGGSAGAGVPAPNDPRPPPPVGKGGRSNSKAHCVQRMPHM